jgi:hypothetical protein
MTPARRDGLWVSLTTLAFALSQGHLAWMLAPLKPNLLALQLAFSAEAFWGVIAAWGEGGVAVYRAHFPFDFIHPFVYGAFGQVLATRTALLGPGRARQLMAWALPVAGAFDLVENTLHLHLLAQPTGSGAGLVPVSASCSALKWGLALVYTLVMAGAIVRRLRRRGGEPAR